MKKLIALALILNLYCSNANAQFAGIGVSGGGNSASFDYQNGSQGFGDFDNSSKFGATGGIKLDFNLANENIKFMPELFFSQNGSKEFFTDIAAVQSGLINNNISLDYLGAYFPLSIYVPLDDGTGITDVYYNGLFFSSSFYVDYVLKATQSNNFITSSEIQFRQNADKIDLGVSVNAGLFYQGMLIEFSYDKGIKDIEFARTESPNTQSEGLLLINNRGIKLKIGYMQKF